MHTGNVGKRPKRSRNKVSKVASSVKKRKPCPKIRRVNKELQANTKDIGAICSHDKTTIENVEMGKNILNCTAKDDDGNGNLWAGATTSIYKDIDISLIDPALRS